MDAERLLLRLSRPGLALALGVLLAACTAPSKHEAATATERTPGPEAARLYGALIGAWNGQLEYVDPKTGRRVRLQTALTVSRVGGTDALRFDYVYDSGGAEPTRSSDRGRVDFAAGIYQVQSIDGTAHSDYTIASHQRNDLPYREELVLAGPGSEDGVPVDTRITITVTELSLRVLREAKPSTPAGSNWQFRHDYVMTRRG